MIIPVTGDMPKQERSIRTVMRSYINMPRHKVIYALSKESMVWGVWQILNRHTIKFSQERHDWFVEEVGDYLEEYSGIEHEWCEDMWNVFVKFDPSEGYQRFRSKEYLDCLESA